MGLPPTGAVPALSPAEDHPVFSKLADALTNAVKYYAYSPLGKAVTEGPDIDKDPNFAQHLKAVAEKGSFWAEIEDPYVPSPDPTMPWNKPFARFRQGLTNMSSDLRRFADRNQPHLTAGAYALLHGVAGALDFTPVGGSAIETAAMLPLGGKGKGAEGLAREAAQEALDKEIQESYHELMPRLSDRIPELKEHPEIERKLKDLGLEDLLRKAEHQQKVTKIVTKPHLDFTSVGGKEVKPTEPNRDVVGMTPREPEEVGRVTAVKPSKVEGQSIYEHTTPEGYKGTFRFRTGAFKVGDTIRGERISLADAAAQGAFDEEPKPTGPQLVGKAKPPELTAPERKPGKLLEMKPATPDMPSEDLAELGLFSPVERMVTNRFPDRMTADQALNTLRNAPGISPAELKFSGLDEFLQGKGNAPITKGEITDFLKQNAVDLEETQLGKRQKLTVEATPSTESKKITSVGLPTFKKFNVSVPTIEDYDSNLRGSYGDMPQGNLHSFKLFELPNTPEGQQAVKQLRAVVRGHNAKIMLKGRGEKYSGSRSLSESKRFAVYLQSNKSQATDWGGKAYEDLTRKQVKGVLDELSGQARDVKTQDVVIKNEKGEVVKTIKGTTSDPQDVLREHQASVAKPQYKSYTLPGPKENYRELLLRLPGKTEYTSPHFHKEGKNLLAHARVNDRTSVDGEHLLFVDEIQSDWANALREYGERKPRRLEVMKASEASERYPQHFKLESSPDYVIVDHDDPGNFTGEVFSTKAEAEHNLMARGGGRGAYAEQGVAPQPFKGNWHELVMKRLTRLAAEEGYDGIAWTTGDQQAERWHLGRVADAIQWDPKTNVLLGMKEGNNVFSREVPKEKLGDYVGKENARRLIESTPGSYYLGKNVHQLKVNEYVGDRWAHRLYDEMIPQFLDKLGNRVGGITIGETKIPNEPGHTSVGDRELGWDKPHTVHVAHLTPEAQATVKEKGLPVMGLDFSSVGGKKVQDAPKASTPEKPSQELTELKRSPLMRGEPSEQVLPANVEKLGKNLGITQYYRSQMSGGTGLSVTKRWYDIAKEYAQTLPDVKSGERTAESVADASLRRALDGLNINLATRGSLFTRIKRGESIAFISPEARGRGTAVHETMHSLTEQELGPDFLAEFQGKATGREGAPKGRMSAEDIFQLVKDTTKLENVTGGPKYRDPNTFDQEWLSRRPEYFTELMTQYFIGNLNKGSKSERLAEAILRTSKNPKVQALLGTSLGAALYYNIQKQDTKEKR